MLNNQGSEAKHAGIVVLDNTLGVKGPEFAVYIENRVRFQCEGVGVASVVACEGRIRGASTWVSLATATSTASAVADVSTYDFIRFNVTTIGGSGTCISSGFISMF